MFIKFREKRVVFTLPHSNQKSLILPPKETTNGLPLPYLPGLDGLRAIAVSAVLLYHAEISWLPGGFLGVEVFFVISGYLITGLLLAEWRKRQRIDLKAFWLRRARRLLPALFLLLLVSLTFAVIFLPQEVAGLRGDALAAFGYVTNWYLILVHKSYFETVGRPPLLQHLWSLAVEEQFYLLWPLLFTAGMVFLRQRRMLFAIVGGAAVSSLLMALLYQPNQDPSRIYYGTDTRASGLLLGAALAFVWLPRPEQARPWQGRKTIFTSLALNLAGLGALLALVGYFVLLDQYQPFLYQGGFALVGLTTALLIAMVVHPLAHLGPSLEWKPVRWVGLRSYSIYLWHWPIFQITRPGLDIALEGLPLLVLRLALTGLLAEISYRWIETPIRQGLLGRLWQNFRLASHEQRRRLASRWSIAATLGLAFVLVLGLMVAGAQPAPPPAYLSGESAVTPVSGATTPATTENPSNGLETATSQPTATQAATPAVAATTDPTLSVIPPTATAAPTATPQPTPTPRPPASVFAFGDSVMLRAKPELEKIFNNDIDVDAAVGRYLFQVDPVIQHYRDRKLLSKTVIIHIGNNGGITDSQFDDMMKELKDVPRVLIVNLKVPRQWESNNNAVLARGAKRYPNTELVDWRAASIGHPEFFWDDAIHLRPEGATFYAKLLANRVKGR